MKSASGGVERVATIPWSAEDFVPSVARILSRDCGKRPVIILNDMVEQHYRKERLPKVGVMDKAQVLQRRLKVAFPNYPIRAALPSKQKIQGAQAKETNKGGLYLFAALPMSEAFTKTMAAVRESYVSIAGFGLLPVEASAMVSQLAKKLGGEEKGKVHWAVFVGQHHSGGLRQIITRNGELALTRMTAMSAAAAADSAQWVRQVATEFKATMGYLSRFGYGSDDILDVVIIAPEDQENNLKALINTPCRLHVVGAHNAGRAIGVKVPREENASMADPLHAAWIAKRPKLLLPMEATQISAVSKPRQVAMLAMLALFGGFCYMAYHAYTGAEAVLTAKSEISDLEDQKVKVEADYQAEVAKKEALGLDIQLIQSSLETYDQLELGSMQPLPVVGAIGKALGGALKLDAIRIIEPRSGLLGQAQAQQQYDESGNPIPPDPRKDYEAFIQLSFKPNIPPEAAVNEINKLEQRLQKLLPEHKVSIIKQAFDMSTSTAFLGKTGRVTEETAEEQDLTAELSIRGKM